jgi:hypothetical protein
LAEQRNRIVSMADKHDTVVIAPPKPNASPFATGSDSGSGIADVAASWVSLPTGIVDGGEVILLAVKPSMWRPFFDSAPWLVTLSLLAVALTVWGTPLPGLSLAASAQVVLLVALSRFAVAVVFWVPTWFVLTNRRVIDIRGVRSPRISALPLLEIRNTYVHVSLPERATGLGTITCVTEREEDSPHHWRSVANPDQVHSEIRRAIEKAIDAQSLS